MRAKLLFFAALAAACEGVACTGFYVGRKVSADGTTLLARTVDSLSVSACKRFEILPAARPAAGALYRATDNGATWPLPAETYRAITVPSVAVGKGRYEGCCINEKGLMLSATVTATANEAAKAADPYVKSGFGESSLPGLLIQTCATAREAVELLGRVIAEKGHHGGEIYMFADEREAWYAEVYTGHQWAAVKLPEDKMLVTGNQFLLRGFDPASPDALASAGIVRVPEEAGFLKRTSEGLIDLAATYAVEPAAAGTFRTWFGRRLFAPGTEGEYADTRRMELLFTPARKVTVRELEEAMRSRAEGTAWCPDGPNVPATRVIGVTRQCTCHVIALDATLSPERRCTMWVTLSNAEHSPFLPLNICQTALAKGFDRGGADSKEAFHPEFPAAHFRRLCALAEQDRVMYGAGVRAYWRACEDKWLEEFPRLVRAGDPAAITDYAVKAEEESLGDAKRIFDELSWHILKMNFGKGDYSTKKNEPPRVPFAPCGAPVSQAVGGLDAEARLLEELIAIPSVSDDIQQNNRAQRHMEAWLKARGVTCVRETMSDGHEMLFASTQPGKEQDYILSVHLDVVPGAPAQFAAKRDGDWVVGRGADDCKGSCVAVARALVGLVGKASVGVIFGADEETGGLTTRWMYEQGYRPRKMVIVVDSRWDAVTYTQKGNTFFRVTARGHGGHSACPWEAEDSIATISKAYLKLRESWDREHPITDDKWCDILSATVLKADEGALNRIPDEASFVVNYRGIAVDGADRTEKFIREVTGLEVTRVSDSKPFASDPNDPLILELQAAMRRQYPGEEIPLARNPAASDARCFFDCGKPIAVIGVCGRDSHGADEAVRLSSVDAVADLLVKFLSR